MKKLAGLAAALAVAWLLYDGPTGAPDAGSNRGGANTGAPVTAPTEPRAPASHAGRGFRSPARLQEHFQAHGGEFRGLSIAQYEVAAQALRDAPVGGDVLEIVRPADGVISRFDRATGAFLAADADGTIRTFFKPNDGEAYFRRQAKRRPSP